MEKMVEEQVYTPNVLSMDGGWEKQVNGRADVAEKEKRYKAAMLEEAKAKRLRNRRVSRAMSALAVGSALILAGGIYLNFVDGFPILASAIIVVVGNSLINFVVGWLFGHRCR